MVLDADLSEAMPKDILTARAKELADERIRYEYEATQLRARMDGAVSSAPDEAVILETCAVIARGIDRFTEDDRRAVIELFDITGLVQRGATPDEDEIVVRGIIPQFSVSATPDPIGDGVEDIMLSGYAPRSPPPPMPSSHAPAP